MRSSEVTRGDGAAPARAMLRATGFDDEEALLNALRRCKSEEVLRIGLYDIAGELEALDRLPLTDAEALHGQLKLMWRQSDPRRRD